MKTNPHTANTMTPPNTTAFDRGRNDEAQFEKVLWRKQPFTDNFVPPSFLSDLRTNSQLVLTTFSQLVLASLRISTRFLCVCLFALLFVHLHQHTIDAELLLLLSITTFILLTLFTSSRASVKRGGKGRTKAAGVLSRTIMALVLLAVSPVLRTLTESTTSDSIWALAVVLFALHLTLADYSEGRAKRLSSTLSFNAAISAGVVLASRLDTDGESFTLLVLAVLLFAPISDRRVGQGEARRGVWGFVGVYGACMIATVWCKGGGEEGEEGRWWWIVAVWVNVVVGFVSVVCPWWIVKAQRWKMEIKGPWDPAEPVLSSSSHM